MLGFNPFSQVNELHLLISLICRFIRIHKVLIPSVRSMNYIREIKDD